MREILNFLRHGPIIIAALRAIRAHDDKLNDASNDGRDARAPDGDDYNAIFTSAAEALRLIES
jgi:hypothetical protein